MLGYAARFATRLAALLLLLPLAAMAETGGSPALPAEAEAYFRTLLPPDDAADLAAIELRFDQASFRFRRGPATAELVLSHPSTCRAPEGPLCLRVRQREGVGGDQLAAAARAALAEALRRSPAGPPWRMTAAAPHRPEDGVEDWRTFGMAFFAALLAGVLIALWRCRQALVSRAALLPAALTLLALVLRLAAQGGPSDIRPVLHNTGQRRAGWDALLLLLQTFTPVHDEIVWNLNRVVGALSVPLLYVVLRRCFADPLVAAAGATALAVTPLLVRFAASDAPYLFLCAAFLGAIVAYDQFARSGAVRALVLALALLTAAMQLRPEGVWLVVPATLVALAAPGQPGLRALAARPVTALALLLGFALVNAVPLVWAVTGHVGGTSFHRYFVLIGAVLGSPWADPQVTPRLLAALVVLGAITAVLRFERAAALWLAAVLVALPFAALATGAFGTGYGYGFALPLGPPVVGHATTFSQYANARYHLPAMVLACGLIGLGVAGLLQIVTRLVPGVRPWALPAAIGLVILAALPRLDVLRTMWTPQREFALLREGLARIDPACRVATLLDVRDAGFVPFEYLAPNRLVDLAVVLEQPQPPPCLVYYRCGNCFTLDLVAQTEWPAFEINPLCRAIESRYALEPILEANVPALPYRGEIYSRDPLPLGLYRLRAAGDGDADPR